MRPRSLRVLFFVQSEGRGHMTQALALEEILESAGHHVVAGLMGENPERPIPEFFKSGFRRPIHTFLAPKFVVDDVGKGVRPWDSFFQAVRRFPRYWSQAPIFHKTVSDYKPDLIVNFFSLIGGLYSAIYRPPAPMVTVGHQFLFFHPAFQTPVAKRFQVEMIRAYTLLCSLNSHLRLGLSFSPLAHLPERRIRVVPPLLRNAVLEAEPRNGRHILTYVLNPGYAEEIMDWHSRQSDIELHCFWDRRDVSKVYSPRAGLTFHQLDGVTFLDLLVSCRGFASTSGFESVCEAAFLGKPISLVPTKKHVEQMANALDAERAGLATWRDDFDLSELLHQSDHHSGRSARRDFRAWVRQAPEIFLRTMESVARGERLPVHFEPSPRKSRNDLS